MDQEIDIPSFFICPISLEIMKDPVTISTGITYDRKSIEKWLFSGKNNTCPVTKQVVSDSDITPNHTLRRLLQAWCTLNASHGIERIPTPQPPVNKTQIAKILRDARKSPQCLSKCLKELRSISSHSEANKRSIEAAGTGEFLASMIISNINNNNNINETEEALSILYNLNLSEDVLKTTLIGKEGEFIEALIKLMQRGSYESRAYAVMLFKSMFEVAEPIKMINLRSEFFIEVVQVLKDQISQQASKATLQLLIKLCPWGRNRIKAVEAGAVMVLIELLLDASSDRRTLEMTLMVLEMICGCAEGRAELLKHGAGLAVISKKIMRVSKVASERAVRILFSICKFSATSSVLQEMMQLGVVAKLCLVLQVDSGSKTKEKAREILKLHARTWRNSTCIPSNLVSSYPS